MTPGRAKSPSLDLLDALLAIFRKTILTVQKLGILLQLPPYTTDELIYALLVARLVPSWKV